MIIGRGLIASLFIDCDRNNTVFFASGVSNSLETRIEEFLREEKLIQKTIKENPDKIFVYFSTCSIYDSSKTGSDYVLHKLKMEQMIKNSCKAFLVLRVSNAVGNGGNPNLLMNYLTDSVTSHTPIHIHTKATRNLIDAEDIKNITLKLLESENLNKILNIAYIRNYSIVEIVETIEQFYHVKAKINFIKDGSGYEINCPETESYFFENNLTDKKTYLYQILEKYYKVR